MLAPRPSPRPAQSLVRRQITLLQERSASNTSSQPFNHHRSTPSVINHDVVQRIPFKSIQQNESTPSLPVKTTKTCSKRFMKQSPSDFDLKARRLKSSYALYQCIEEDRLDVYDVPPPAKVLSEPSTPAKSAPNSVLGRHSQIARSLSSLLETGQMKWSEKKVDNDVLTSSTLPRQIQCETTKIQSVSVSQTTETRSHCQTDSSFVSKSKSKISESSFVALTTESKSQVRTTEAVSQAYVTQTSESRNQRTKTESSVGQSFLVQSTESKHKARSESLANQTDVTQTAEHKVAEETASPERQSPRREPRRHQLWRRFSSFNPCTRWEDWSGTSHKAHAKKCMEDTHKRAATLPTALISPPSTSPLPLPVSNRPLPPTPAGVSTSPASSLSSSSSGANLASTLVSRPWFHDVDRRRAEELVRNGLDGYFLVRPSSKSSNALTLTMWYNKRVYNISIRVRPDGRIALGTAKPNEQSFATVDEMVANYQSENLVLFSGGKRTGLTVLTTYPPHKN